MGKETAFSAQEAKRAIEELREAGASISEILADAARAIPISVKEFDAAEGDDA